MDFKVVTAVATEPVSLAEARLQVRLMADDGTTEDELFAVWIKSARETAERYTGRALAAQTLEAVLDAFPSCSEGFDLPRPPVASITSIKYTDTDGVEQTIGTDAYSLSSYGDARTVNLAYGESWPSTQGIPNAVRVRYVTGYGAPGQNATGEYAAVPQAAKAAILLMVAWMYEHRGDEMSPDDIQPPAAKALLNTVKVWGF